MIAIGKETEKWRKIIKIVLACKRDSVKEEGFKEEKNRE